LAVADLVAKRTGGVGVGATVCSTGVALATGRDAGSSVWNGPAVATEPEPPQANVKKPNTKTAAATAGYLFLEMVGRSLKIDADIFNPMVQVLMGLRQPRGSGFHDRRSSNGLAD